MTYPPIKNLMTQAEWEAAHKDETITALRARAEKAERERDARLKTAQESYCAKWDEIAADRDRLAAQVKELEAKLAEASVPCCDVCGDPYTEASADGRQHRCHTKGCPRCDDGHWYSGVSYVTPAKELAVRLGKALRGIMDERDAARAEVARLTAEVEGLRARKVIMPPRLEKCVVPEYADGFNMGRAHVIDAIRAAGIAVEP
jgi:hypothetical protein